MEGYDYIIGTDDRFQTFIGTILSKFVVILIILIWRVRWIYFLDRGCSRVSEVEVARPTQVGQVTTKLRKIPVFGSLINLSPRKTTKVSKFLSISFSSLKNSVGRWSKSPFASLRFNQPDNTCSCVGQLDTQIWLRCLLIKRVAGASKIIISFTNIAILVCVKKHRTRGHLFRCDLVSSIFDDRIDFDYLTGY